MGALSTLEALAAFMRLPLDTIDEDAGETALLGASAIVRTHLHQDLDYTVDDVITLHSTGGRLLLLPQLPVIEVALVRLRSVGSTDFVELEQYTDYEVELGREGKLWRVANSFLGVGFLGTFPAGEWPRGAGRGPRGWVEVTYTHGYHTAGGYEDPRADDLPETIATVVNRVAARGYINPEAVSQETTGRATNTQYSTPGLYLSDADKLELHPYRAGGRGGSR